MTQNISVVVCCYNSALRLPQTLKHIAAQKLSDTKSWELIIVNNNSTDATEEVASIFLRSHPDINMKIVREGVPGLSHARHKGLKMASYEYVILCDDDNWLAENYLQTICDFFDRNPEIGIVGGIGKGVTNGQFPYWFERNKGAFAVDKPFEPGYVKYVFGAGMGLRKSVFFEAIAKGFVSRLSDRKGKELSSGGDLELCYIYQMMGYKVLLSEQLHFTHFIESSRLTTDYWKRLNKGFAKTVITLRPYDLVLTKRSESSLILWAKEFAYILKSAAKNMFKKDQDWNYLKSALKLMVSHKKQFCENVDAIRAFANLQKN